MASNPFQVVRDFEAALCEYTGSRYAVTTTSCTAALMLAVALHVRKSPDESIRGRFVPRQGWRYGSRALISIPNRTYISVPQSIIHAGAWPEFRGEAWLGAYQLKPLPVWDSARRFTSGMYVPGQFQCVSFHTTKILGDTQGGAILHDDPQADAWLRRARFDGRTEGVRPKDDHFDMVGWHCYMSPDVAARLLWNLSVLPKHNLDLPNDDYPDLSQIEAFK